MGAESEHMEAFAPDDPWMQLIEIHNHAKSVFLCAEEFDSSFRDFLQPILELRHCLDHIIRVKAAERGINGEVETKEPEYVKCSVDKAIGHVYRAFFDAADWFSVCIRERITKALKWYSHDCITAVIPNYYPELRPRVDRICMEIAAIRGGKDIAKKNNLLPEVTEYRTAIDDLLKIHGQIQSCVPALVDWRWKNRWNAFIIWVVGAFLGGIAITVFTVWLLAKLGFAKP
jgi:hypothetical protein